MKYLELFSKNLNVTFLINFGLIPGINTDCNHDKYQLISSDKEALKKVEMEILKVQLKGL